MATATRTTLDDLRTLTYTQIRSAIDSGNGETAKKWAKMFLQEFVASRLDTLDLDDVELLTHGLGFERDCDMFAGMNGPWGEQNFGLHFTVEWRWIYIDGTRKIIAMIHYREV